MIFSEERTQVICSQLKTLEKVQKLDITDWSMKEGLYFRPEEADRAQAPWKEFNSRTDAWYGPDRHYWFRTNLTVPESFNGKPLWLIFRTQIEEWDDGKNPQFLLFVNGKITQGLDMNHREVFLTNSARTGGCFQIDLQAYTGTLHSEFRLIAEMAEIDPEIRGLYYDMQVPLWSFSRMENDSKNRYDMAAVLNHAVNLLDFRDEYSPAFYESVRKARKYLAEAMYTDLAGDSSVVATCIGHTHIDVAWWWTVAQTREKAARSFSTVLKLMDEYPDYRFMSSQPQLYEFVKDRYPEIYAEIRERVKEKHWEPEGAMWLESDCNLTSGESLVRQILFGKRFFREEFGVDSKVLWLPDAFGFNGALPQIMKKSGIRYFMTTKISWSQFDKFPYDTFLWRGIDGSEILTHFITTVGVGQKKDQYFTTYNGMLHPDAIMGAWQRYQNKEINNDILIAFGYGDGGGGPTRAMLETSRRMEKGLRGVPKVRQEFAGTYFEELERRVKDNPQLPTWEGELYLEYHRGTYTSMARNKRANRKSELMLMDLELFSVLADVRVKYPKEELDRMWKTVLLNQFHDILPGSSIHEVYEVTKKEYAEITETGRRLIGERLKSLAGSGNSVAVFNTVGFERGSLLNLGHSDAAALMGGGQCWPVQQTGEGAVAYVRGLPPKGCRSFAVSTEAVPQENPFKIDGNSITTPFYRVTFGSDGTMTSIYDRENDREILQEGRCGNRLRVYEDKPIYFDNWDIDIYYKEKSWDIDGLTKMEWTERGPVRAALHLEYAFSKSTVSQTVYFYADDRRIDFKTVVDWHEHQHLLKVHFPVEVHTDEATFEIQFGNITRKIHRNTSWDTARFESCGHRWMDLSEGGYGVSLLNDCKYGHSAYHGDMALTLIKSGIEPNKTADQEKHFFTYALYPHAGTWREAGTAREAACLNQPAYAVPGASDGLDFSLFRVDAKNIMADTVKKAEDGNGIILRMYEYENRRGKASVTFGEPVSQVFECDLMENDLHELLHSKRDFTFRYKPYEIKTFRVVPEP